MVCDTSSSEKRIQIVCKNQESDHSGLISGLLRTPGRIFKSNGSYEKRIQPLFPGYIFVITDTIDAFYDELKKVDGFKRVLKEGDFFTPISKEEAAFIAGFTDDDYNIGMSEGYILDSKVYITSGPLLGREGVIKKIDRHKRLAIIELYFMGQPQLVRMPLEIVSKL